MDGFQFSLIILFLLALLVFIFFICREIFCWYWKLNDIKELLSELVSTLKEIKGRLETGPEKREIEPGEGDD